VTPDDLAEISAHAAAGTPGPWYIEGELIMDAARCRIVVIVGNGSDDPRVGHDAALVAAAPELLDALRVEQERVATLETAARTAIRHIRATMDPDEAMAAAQGALWDVLPDPENDSASSQGTPE
jgi:hypothetical protein